MKNSEKSDYLSYCSTNLMSIAEKILVHILLNRLPLAVVEELLSDYHFGFHVDQGTTHMILPASDSYEMKNMALYVAFIDLFKAFDMVIIVGLWKILSKIRCLYGFLTILN